MKHAATFCPYLLALLLLPACGHKPPKSDVTRGGPPLEASEMERAVNLAIRAVEQYERQDPEHALISLRMAEEVVRSAAKGSTVDALQILTARLPEAYRKYDLGRLMTQLESLVQRQGAPSAPTESLSTAAIPNPTPPPETERLSAEGHPLIVEDTIYSSSGSSPAAGSPASSGYTPGLPVGFKDVTPPRSVQVHSVNEDQFVRNELDRLMAEFGEMNFNPPASFLGEVQHSIDWFQGEKHEFYQNTLQRSVTYAPLIEKLFQKKGVPSDLIYMAFVESGFQPDALSRSGARGLWQLMPGTAQDYGLEVSRRKDERLDAVRSTLAAREYFLDLLSIFGTRSWLLAMAAYNAGENKITSCLKQIDDPFAQRTFWHIRQCMQSETQDYVPRILAAAIIASDPGRFGFQAPRAAAQRQFETVALPSHTSIAALLQAGGIRRDDLLDLNPDLAPEQRTTPAATADQPYRLNVPVGTGNRIVQQWSELARIGRSLTPDPSGPVASTRSTVEDRVQKASYRTRTPSGRSHAKSEPDYFVYRVAAGNTMAEIAQTFGVDSYREIMRWNAMKRSTVAHSQQLKIFRPFRRVQYKVHKGDTLEKLSQKFGVSAQKIKFYNGLKRKTLPAGQTLWIYVPNA
jgi:peptidoglycan lytic transglycosylase D